MVNRLVGVGVLAEPGQRHFGHFVNLFAVSAGLELRRGLQHPVEPCDGCGRAAEKSDQPFGIVRNRETALPA